MKYYALTREGSKNIILIGTKSEMCSEWGKLKYQKDQENKYSVIPITVSYDCPLFEKEIEEQIQYDYDKIGDPNV